MVANPGSWNAPDCARLAIVASAKALEPASVENVSCFTCALWASVVKASSLKPAVWARTSNVSCFSVPAWKRVAKEDWVAATRAPLWARVAKLENVVTPRETSKTPAPLSRRPMSANGITLEPHHRFDRREWRIPELRQQYPPPCCHTM